MAPFHELFRGKAPFEVMAVVNVAGDAMEEKNVLRAYESAFYRISR